MVKHGPIDAWHFNMKDNVGGVWGESLTVAKALKRNDLQVQNPASRLFEAEVLVQN